MGIVRLLREPSSPGFEREATPADAVLVRAAQEGEVWAQEALFRRHVPMAAGLAHRLLGGRQGFELDDLVQQGFGQALQHLHRLRVPEAFSSWLGSLVVRAAARRLRLWRVQSWLGFWRKPRAAFETLISPSVPIAIQRELCSLYVTLDRLPTDERIALVLCKVEGMALCQIADAMGVRLSTAKRKLWQAERRLHQARELDCIPPRLVLPSPAEAQQSIGPELSEARVARLWSGISRRIRHQQERQRRFWPHAVALLLPVATFACLGTLYLLDWLPASARTDTLRATAFLSTQGDTMSMILHDGSLLEMAPRSQVELETVSHEQVLVQLSQGQLTCDVTSNEGRSFAVHAGGIEVRGNGTRFSVKRLPGADLSRVEVRVQRGSVEVRRQENGAPTRHLSAGESWVIEEQGALARVPDRPGHPPKWQGHRSAGVGASLL